MNSNMCGECGRVGLGKAKTEKSEGRSCVIHGNGKNNKRDLEGSLRLKFYANADDDDDDDGDDDDDDDDNNEDDDDC
ncbi:hypothetical protein M0802_007311 [Mischocyttarus mexicanus]|nr:hypothetical protein M0802_007311 [Mischocyttarus mexicanus]